MTTTTNYNTLTEIITNTVFFYFGIIMFLILCLFPPFIILLPYAIPIIFIICMIVNISLIIQITSLTTTQLNSTIQSTVIT